jgi:membrane associated rhomboid family serine protease
MPPVTATLIAVTVAIFFLQAGSPGLVDAFALWPFGSSRLSADHAGFRPWQVASYAFLHGSLLHLFFNMFALYMFGGAVERVLGTGRYVVYWSACVLTAAAAQLAVSALSGAFYPTVGASGGVFGLLLAYAVFFPRARVMLLFPPIPMKARVFVVLYAAIELVLGVTGSVEGVAHFAHLGGMVGGWLLLTRWGARAVQ